MERLVILSDAQGYCVLIGAVNPNDHINCLPKDVLLSILDRISTGEAVATSVLSTRWKNMWKETSLFFIDMRRIRMTTTPLDVGRSITKVINDHRRDLEKCTIYHYSNQCEVGMVETWIQSLIQVKHVKDLTLVNTYDSVRPKGKSNITLVLSPESFSYPSFESLSLSQYNFEAPHGLNRCCNLKIVKLAGVYAELEFFNAMLLACASLEALALEITCHKKNGTLKIENPKLKFLYLTCGNIDSIEVSTLSLEILIVGSLNCAMEKLVIINPWLQFTRNYWAAGGYFPHTSYIISYPDQVCIYFYLTLLNFNQEKKCIAHEFMIRGSAEYMKRFASMSVSVDLKNKQEVEMLKEVLVAWNGEMQEIEIIFKNNDAHEEVGESCIGGTLEMFSEDAIPFPNAHFRVFNVWFSNLSGSEEEFALASHWIERGMVVRTMLIKPSSSSLRKKWEIEAAVAILNELPKGHQELGIFMFGI